MINGADYEKVKQHLLSVANIIAPTQQGFVRIVAEMEYTQEDHEDILKALLNRLTDGLRFGNWPS